MLITETIPMKIINFNMDFYKQKGYNCKIGEILDIKIEDVSEHSKAKIKISCDSCGTEKEITIERYNKSDIYNKDKYLCEKCLKEELNNRKCEICGDTHGVSDYLNKGKLLCQKHQRQMRKYGEIRRTAKDTNEIRIFNDYAEFDTYDNKTGEVNGTFKIDLDMIDFVEKHKCHKHYDGYACCHIIDDNGQDKKIRLHRAVLGLQNDKNKNIVVDHINRDKSDDRRCNLRTVTHEANNRNTGMYCHNTSGIKGVSWNKQKEKWEVYIHQYNKKINLGLYEDKNRAIQVREIAEIIYYGTDSPRYEELIHKYIGNKLIKELMLKKTSKEDK